MSGAQGRIGVARIGVDGIVEGSPGGIIRHVEPLPRGEALKAHRLADGDALGIHSLRIRAPRVMPPGNTQSRRRRSMRRVEHSHRGMKDRHDVGHAVFITLSPGTNCGKAMRATTLAAIRQRRDGMLFFTRKMRTSRVEHARGIDEGLRPATITSRALLAEA